jgi:aspartate aminotransferase
MNASKRITDVSGRLERLYRFFIGSPYARRQGDPGIADFVVGNPHDPVLPGFVDALSRAHVPQNPQWYAYKLNEPEARAPVAAGLRRRLGLPFADDDVFLTPGAFAAIAVILAAITDPGDEVIFVSPPWFYYEALIVAAGARPVRVRCDAETFDLDLAAIEAAITPRTRALIVNSPNNPTGRIYPAATLAELGERLAAAGERHGRPIYVISDEAYCRIVYDGRDCPSPAQHYPNTFVVYTYGKTLLAPGQRLGYIALPPAMPGREELRPALLVAQLVTGYAFPNALLQHALADLEQLSIDVGNLQAKRDRLVAALRAQGYELHVPEGTFYLLPRSPWPDDEAFVAWLAERDVFCLPGAIVELPGTFRISLTGTDEMITRALPVFAAAREATPARERKPG